MAYNEEDRYKHQAYQFLVDRILRQRGQEMGGLANLIRASEFHPEAGSQALARYGINVRPGMSRRDAALRQAMQLAAFRAATRGRAGALPADLVGAIGTPDFSRRLQDAAASGIDRQSLQTLVDLDRKEREFAAKAAKPGKLSPAAQKLRELEALGIPVTEEVLMGVYAPALAASPEYISARNKQHAMESAKGIQPRTFSLSQLAGITEGPAAAGEETATVENEEGAAPIAPADDRRSRLRSLLFGGGAEY